MNFTLFPGLHQPVISKPFHWLHMIAISPRLWREWPSSHTFHRWSPRPVALTGHVVHRPRASDGTAAPHWEITQRWDLMALRLSGSEKPTSDPQHWPLLTPPILQGPVLVTGHLSNPSHWSDYRPIWDLPTTHFLDQDKLLSATLHDNKWPDCCGKSKGTSICSIETREMAKL